MTGASKGYPCSRLQPGRDPKVVLKEVQPWFSIFSGTSAWEAVLSPQPPTAPMDTDVPLASAAPQGPTVSCPVSLAPSARCLELTPACPAQGAPTAKRLPLWRPPPAPKVMMPSGPSLGGRGTLRVTPMDSAPEGSVQTGPPSSQTWLCPGAPCSMARPQPFPGARGPHVKWGHPCCRGGRGVKVATLGCQLPLPRPCLPAHHKFPTSATEVTEGRALACGQDIWSVPALT